jgi:phage host-nuclease inhibitor protein Gam
MKKTATPRPRSAAALLNRLDFELAVDRVSYLQTEIRQLQAERDRAVQQAQALHQHLLGELEAELEAKLSLAANYARDHRAELLPGPAKTAETPLSRWGFRTGMPQLRLAARLTWEKVVADLQAHGLAAWLRVKTEAAKDAMLASAQADADAAEKLARFGVRVVQQESFFVEPKLDEAHPETAR